MFVNQSFVLRDTLRWLWWRPEAARQRRHHRPMILPIGSPRFASQTQR